MFFGLLIRGSLVQVQQGEQKKCRRNNICGIFNFKPVVNNIYIILVFPVKLFSPYFEAS
jgi:hypothetical protein